MVSVCELHARIALQCSDLNEFNQVQTKLMYLYRMGLSGACNEFIALRILYYVCLTMNAKYVSGSSDLVYTLQDLSPIQYQDDQIRFALQIRASVQMQNYLSFFRLSTQTTNESFKYLLNTILPQIRLKYLCIMAKAYRPTLSLQYMIETMNFDAFEEAMVFFRSTDCVILKGKTVLTTKDLWTKEGTIKVSESLSPELVIDMTKTVVNTDPDVAGTLL
jgi:SAC3 family protein LENG8/THP3